MRVRPAFLVLTALALPLAVPAWRSLRLACLRVPGQLPVPVAGVAPRAIADTFGAPRPGHRRHHGLDIFAPRHTPVRSATRGLVLAVGEDRLGGRTVRVLGPGWEWHYYAHLESYGPVRPGQWIEAGQVLGTVGDSGNARGTPTHLHYGTYRFPGRAVDPWGRFR